MGDIISEMDVTPTENLPPTASNFLKSDGPIVTSNNSNAFHTAAVNLGITNTFKTTTVKNLLKIKSSVGKVREKLSSYNFKNQTESRKSNGTIASQMLLPTPFLPAYGADVEIVECPSFILPFICVGPPLKQFRDVLSSLNSEFCNGELTNIAEKPEPKSYFEGSRGQFFMEIGSNLVREFVDVELLENALSKADSSEPEERSRTITTLTEGLKVLSEVNAPYRLKLKRCYLCPFNTESLLVMNHHLEVPHVAGKKYRCNFCERSLFNPDSILVHTLRLHRMESRFEKPLLKNPCPLCPSEFKTKVSLKRHMVRCCMKYVPETNQAPFDVHNLPAKQFKMGEKPSEVLRNVDVLQQKTPSQEETDKLQRDVNSNIRMSSGALPSTTTSADVSDQAAATAAHVSECEICRLRFDDDSNLSRHMYGSHRIKISAERLMKQQALGCTYCPMRYHTEVAFQKHLLQSHDLIIAYSMRTLKQKLGHGQCLHCPNSFSSGLINHIREDHRITLEHITVSYRCPLCMLEKSYYSSYLTHFKSLHSWIPMAAEPQIIIKIIN